MKGVILLKKITYLFFALFIIGAVFVFQSCNEAPLTQDSQVTDAGGLNLIPNSFFGAGTGFPQKCPAGPQKLELWSGAGNPSAATLIGYVEFLNVTQTSMTVKYVINVSPWYFSSIHFHISDILSGIPVNNSGNPVPGQFKYKFDFPQSNNTTTYSFQVNLPADPGNDGYFVAAHAGSCRLGGLSEISALLPTGPIEVCIDNKYGPNGYWDFHLNNAGLFNGQYSGYCIDAQLTGLEAPNCYTSHIYSSLGTFPSGLVAHPENVGLLNWIINNFTPGVTTVTRYGYIGTFEPPFNINNFYVGNDQSDNIVTMCDIQLAIWWLVSNGTGQTGSAPYNLSRVFGIIYQAYTTSGAAQFVPGCGQKVALFMDPASNAPCQPIMLAYPVPCTSTGCETAWGDGKYGANFPNAKQWGTYFKWDDICH